MHNFYGQIREGMVVRSAEGDKLGKVISCTSDTFVIEKGLLFPRDYIARFTDVTEIRDGEIFLSRRLEDLRQVGETSDYSYDKTTDTTAGQTTERSFTGIGQKNERLAGEEEVRVPLVEEQLEVERRTREAGEVRIRKEVKTEEKTITVPVTREEIHVERVPVSDQTAATRANFRDETISIPVVEEEIEVRKRPVVREEVRVSKTRHQEQRVASATVRREEVDVDDETARNRKTDVDVERGDLPVDPDKDKYRY